jgi:hypothetical protein
MLTDIHSVLRSSGRRKDKTALVRFFAAPEIISLAGRQNPTSGTTMFFDAIRDTENLHEINSLRRSGTFGTVVARRFRVVKSPSRPHCIQYLLPLL